MTSYLQDLRHKLQKRVNKLRSVKGIDFSPELRRFFAFIEEHKELSALTAELAAQYPDIPAQLDEQLAKGGSIEGETASESARIGYEVLSRCFRDPGKQGLSFMNYASTGSLADSLESVVESFLEPFYEYLDEHLEDRDLVLAQLLRFKHLAEWF